MKNLKKTISILSLCLSLIACKQQSDLLESNSSQTNSKVGVQTVVDPIIEPLPIIERTKLPVSIIGAELTDEKNINISLQHSDLRNVNYRIELGVCKEVYPAVCDAKVIADKAGLVILNNQVVETEVEFSSIDYIQRGIGELVFTDDYGRRESITLQEKIVLQERDVVITNVVVDSKKDLFTVFAYTGCLEHTGDIQLRNLLTETKEILDIPLAEDEALHRGPTQVLRKMSAVVTYQKHTYIKLDHPQAISPEEDQPVRCTLNQTIKKTFKFSEFGISKSNGLSLQNKGSSSQVFEVLDTESRSNKLAHIRNAELILNDKVLQINTPYSTIGLQITNKACAYPLAVYIPDARFQPNTFCSADLVSENVEFGPATREDSSVNGITIAPESFKRYSAKDLGLTAIGMKLKLNHSSGFIEVTLVEDNKLEMMQAFH